MELNVSIEDPIKNAALHLNTIAFNIVNDIRV